MVCQLTLSPSLNLSKEDLAIAKLICLPYKVIGNRLYLSESTIKSHVWKMLGIFGVENRAALVVQLLKHGVVDIGELELRNFTNGTYAGTLENGN